MRLVTVVFSLLLTTPSLSFASWQLAGSPVRTSGDQPNKIVNDTPPAYRTHSYYTLKTHKGLLITTVRQYAGRLGWRVTWMAKRDYPLNIVTTITGPDFQSVLDNLLAHYPLKAYYNTSSYQVTIKRH